MKRFIPILIIFLYALPSRAQEDAITRYFGNYENRDDFTTIVITSRMFGLIAQIPESENEEDIMNITRKLTGLKIITSNEYPDKLKLYNDASKLLKNKGFDELMVIKEGEEEINFLIDEAGGKIAEFIMLIGGQDNFFLMSMTGNLTLRDISRLSKTMDIEGFEHLDKVDEK